MTFLVCMQGYEDNLSSRVRYSCGQASTIQLGKTDADLVYKTTLYFQDLDKCIPVQTQCKSSEVLITTFFHLHLNIKLSIPLHAVSLILLLLNLTLPLPHVLSPLHLSRTTPFLFRISRIPILIRRGHNLLRPSPLPLFGGGAAILASIIGRDWVISSDFVFKTLDAVLYGTGATFCRDETGLAGRFQPARMSDSLGLRKSAWAWDLPGPMYSAILAQFNLASVFVRIATRSWEGWVSFGHGYGWLGAGVVFWMVD